MRSIAALALTATALLVGTTTSSPADASVPQGTTFLDNGIVRVGVDLSNGAKITFVGAATGASTNLVQDVQPSYYSGPYGEGGFPGWHAFSSGATKVLTSRNDGRTIYTKTLAADERAGPCECLFEQWVTIKGRAILVRNRLTAWRSDATRYAASPQELPALYTTGRTYRVFTYDGRRPYTGAPLHEVTEDAGGFFRPGPSWLATEHWAAVVDDGGFGIGLFKPDLVRFAGTPGTPGDGWVNGYLAASTTEVIDANQVYDYDYALVVGSLRQIRSYAYANRPDARPDYRFRTDRQHWWYSGATDRGSPIRGVPARARGLFCGAHVRARGLVARPRRPRPLPPRAVDLDDIGGRLARLGQTAGSGSRPSGARSSYRFSTAASTPPRSGSPGFPGTPGGSRASSSRRSRSTRRGPRWTWPASRGGPAPSTGAQRPRSRTPGLSPTWTTSTAR